MIEERSFLLLLLTFLVGGCASEHLHIEVQPSAHFDGLIYSGHTFDLPAGFAGDAIAFRFSPTANIWEYQLEITGGDGRVLGERVLLSLDEQFSADLIDLTGDGMEEVVLVYCTGRGPGTRHRSMSIFTFTEGGMKELASVPVRESFGEISHWWYEHRFIIENGKPAIELTLHHDPFGESIHEDKDAIPKVPVRLLSFATPQR